MERIEANCHPIRENVLVKPFPSEDKSEGGIFVPDSVKTRNNKALVVAVGNGTKRCPMQFSEGMVIHNIKDCGEEVIINGEKHFLVKSYDILAID